MDLKYLKDSRVEMNINYFDTILNYLSIQKLELMDEDKLNFISSNEIKRIYSTRCSHLVFGEILS